MYTSIEEPGISEDLQAMVTHPYLLKYKIYKPQLTCILEYAVACSHKDVCSARLSMVTGNAQMVNK